MNPGKVRNTEKPESDEEALVNENLACEKIEKRTREESEEVLRECAFRENKFRNQNQRSSRNNVWLRQIAPLNTTRQPSETIREN